MGGADDQDQAARVLEAEVKAWLARGPTGLGLSEAVLQDRAGPASHASHAPEPLV
jgi:hypothetical protein